MLHDDGWQVVACFRGRCRSELLLQACGRESMAREGRSSLVIRD